MLMENLSDRKRCRDGDDEQMALPILPSYSKYFENEKDENVIILQKWFSIIDKMYEQLKSTGSKQVMILSIEESLNFKKVFGCRLQTINTENFHIRGFHVVIKCDALIVNYKVAKCTSNNNQINYYDNLPMMTLTTAFCGELISDLFNNFTENPSQIYEIKLNGDYLLCFMQHNMKYLIDYAFVKLNGILHFDINQHALLIYPTFEKRLENATNCILELVFNNIAEYEIHTPKNKMLVTTVDKKIVDSLPWRDCFDDNLWDEVPFEGRPLAKATNVANINNFGIRFNWDKNENAMIILMKNS
jgi:hypothetical protein